MSTDLGYYGEKKTLLVRQGATLGPFVCTIVNQDDTPFPLTNKVIRGSVRTKETRQKLADFTVTIPNQSSNAYSWMLPASVTATFPASDNPKDESAIHEYDLEMADTVTGVVIPLYYGPVPTLRENTL